MWIITLLIFSIGNKFYGLEIGRTMAFVTLGLCEMIHSFNVRADESIFKSKIFSNKYLCGAFLLGFIMQVGIVIIPMTQKIFYLTSLNITQWIITFGFSVLPIIVMELQKKLNEINFGKVVYGYKEARG